MIKPIKIVLIAGPTASGKSNIAIKIAKRVNGEIINADSMQVYKELRILTARPLKRDQRNIKHHLYGVININKKFSTGHWLKEATKKIQEIRKKNKTPILVGGTGLYFNSLINGLVKIPNIPITLRKNIRLNQKKIGQKKFYKKLLKIDPKVKKKIDQNDVQRSIRAFEIKYYTKISIYDWLNNTKPIFRNSEFCKLYVNYDRNQLVQRIEKRTNQMVKNGALKEVKKFNKLNINKDHSINKAIGINELKDHINNLISLDEAKELISIKTRQYAKRQSTWARGKMSSWININPYKIDLEIKKIFN